LHVSPACGGVTVVGAVDPMASLTESELATLRAAAEILSRFVPPAPPRQNASDEDWISLQTAAARAGRSDDTILLWVRCRKIEGRKLGGRWRVSAASLRHYLEK
jgi:excisionase family DNA binding protein